jgi:RNA polymerase sigma-70 factor (ECF subfamily)
MGSVYSGQKAGRARMPDDNRSDGEARRRRFEDTAVGLMPVVYRVARRLARDADEAADLTQESFLRAYRTFDSFTPGTNCKAWLLTILYSVFINRYRRDRRAPMWTSLDAVDTQSARLFAAGPGDGQAHEPLLQEIEGLEPEVQHSLDALPEPFRAALLLVDVEDLTYEEAAAVLGCPVGTLRSRLFRGRRQLFHALRDYARRAGYLKTRSTS